MLYPIAVTMLVFWGLGLMGNYTKGGFIHLLLIIAIVMVLVHLIQE